MLNDFKQFLMRGNILDLAVGVIIGGAFGKITESLVKDILMPPIGLLLGNVDFSNLFITLGATQYATLAEAQKAGAATINYGLFINGVVNFIIVAFAVFLLIRQVNRLMAKPAPAAEPTTKTCPFCHTDIPLAATRCPHCTSTL